MSEGRQPNILLIVSDQHRYDCMGHTSHGRVRTPHLDGLARDGARFTSAFTPAPLCTPARQALLTGRRPEAYGGLWNYDLGPSETGLTPDVYTWTAALQEVGYRSRYLGKWHVSERDDPTAFGYEQYVPLEAYPTWRRERYAEVGHDSGWFGEIDPVPLGVSRTHWLAEQACDVVRELAGGDRPWHVRVDFLEPHLPCRPVREFADRYPPESVPPWGGFADEFVNKPYIQRQQLVTWGVDQWTWHDWAPVVARYFGIISQLDDAVGRVLAALEESGAADDTIVVYTADHGDMCGSHRMMDKHYVMYDDVVRVPLLLRWPGVVEPGTVREDLVSNALDLPPTLVDAAGAKPSPAFVGRPLLTSAEDRHEVVATYNGQQFGLFTQRMLRTRHWKYVWNATDVDELYDLHADPHELVNRIADPPPGARLPELRRRLHDILVADGDRIVDNPWLAEQFRTGRKLATGRLPRDR